MEAHAPRCATLALALSVELCSACASAADAGVPAASLGTAKLLGGVERNAPPVGGDHAGTGLQRRTEGSAPRAGQAQLHVMHLFPSAS